MRNPGLRLLAALTASAALLTLAACGSGAGPEADGTDGLQPVTLALGWVTQAEWAGYYAAQEQGFYREAGLDVTIRPGGPDVSAQQIVGSGQAELGTDSFGNTLSAIDQGASLKAIAQTTARPGYVMVSRKSAGIESPADWVGKRIGSWAGDQKLYATMAKYGIDPDTDVTMVQQGFDMNQFLAGDVDIASAYAFNELGQVLASGIPAEELNVYSFAEDDTSVAEDGIFVNGDFLESNRDDVAAFVTASMRGWAYCRDAAEHCVELVVQQGTALDADFQTYQMNQMNQLIWPSVAGLGSIDEEWYQQSIDLLHRYGVISRELPLDEVADLALNEAATAALNGVDRIGEGYSSPELPADLLTRG
ncbi:NitT/TauT family transport system substrate-binding protein [Pseudonocardia autotrophica]|uniref:Thiamine pyrimidine synthase n=3 Tax=Pseudonocardiaceae TaxID=2070 RepID=A0A1Y2MTU9_PSEAH|nr:putative thiamine biosynthesis protein [Pseudonocardia autotrophica]TDN74659.1 NitT/TauT family transport system substrate-binding protein [Pseudonocardia autotrophica]BBG05431.1 nitrate ABC transporter substrate-binding protein [Pseudonocardia autotrophica]GEC26398.1 nitrate ABC transporter substrate-binding protein [Pseudonocardia saturnea]